MKNTPKPGSAYSFNTATGPLLIIVEHVVRDAAIIRFLSDCQTKATIPISAITTSQTAHLDYEKDSRRLQFLTGPGIPITHEAVRSYLAARARELSDIAIEAQRKSDDFNINIREVRIKFLREHA